MRYNFDKPFEAIKRPEIQDLIERHRKIYEGFGFACISNISNSTYDNVVWFRMRQESHIPESIGVMRTVEFLIADYCFFDCSQRGLKRPHINMDAHIMFNTTEQDWDDMTVIGGQWCPKDSRKASYIRARLLDSLSLMTIYNDLVQEDIHDDMLTIHVKTMLDIVPRKMIKLGFELAE